jgi:hypothetical protein
MCYGCVSKVGIKGKTGERGILTFELYRSVSGRRTGGKAAAGRPDVCHNGDGDAYKNGSLKAPDAPPSGADGGKAIGGLALPGKPITGAYKSV